MINVAIITGGEKQLNWVLDALRIFARSIDDMLDI